MVRSAEAMQRAAERTAVWRAANPERANAARDRWTEANKEHVRAYKAQWARDNRDRVRQTVQAGKHRRKAQMRSAPSEKFYDIDIFDRDQWICGLCSLPIDKSLQYPHPMYRSLDHIIPLSRGGGHTRDNVQAAHLRCNKVKNGRLSMDRKIEGW